MQLTFWTEVPGKPWQGGGVSELLILEQAGSYSWQLLFKWQHCWNVVSFCTEGEGGVSSVFFLQVPRNYVSGSENMLAVRPGEWSHWGRCEVGWVERGFRHCTLSLVGIPCGLDRRRTLAAEANLGNFPWLFPSPQLKLSAPLSESAPSPHMFSSVLPQDLCPCSAFCQECFFPSSSVFLLIEDLSLNTAYLERLSLATISKRAPNSHSLSHHPYFLKLSWSLHFLLPSLHGLSPRPYRI